MGSSYDAPAILKAAREMEGDRFSFSQLYRHLGVPKKRRSKVRKLVRKLASEGELVRSEKPERYALAGDGAGGRIRGRVQSHPDGFAFLLPEDPDREDVYLSRKDRGTAMHGDSVLVEARPGKGGRGPQGRVVEILKRANTTVVGRFVGSKGAGRVMPFESKVATPVEIEDAGDANTGMMVEAEITSFPRKGGPARARIVEVLGYPDEKGVDVAVVLRHFGIEEEHGPKAMAEAEAAPDHVRDADRKGRQDLRELETVTIDGETARDFDDAVSLKRTGKGYKLWVHIADVSHYVREGSAIDEEAWDRATSVYFPERAVHMLPEALSAGICSLRPGEDRLAMTAEILLDENGRIKRTSFYESVIRSDERMTYTDVKRILEDRDEAVRRRYAGLEGTFQLMEEVARILMKWRDRRGSLDFDLPEPILVLDEKGVLTEVLPSERNIAHRIIEELMILTNHAVAAHMQRHGLPALYRVHEDPDPQKIKDLAEFAAGFGLSLEHEKGEVEPRDLAHLVEQAEGGREERLISDLTLRSMARARYGIEPLGHFGLALDDYLHFTSPIRRYPDLVVHRLLKESLQGEAPSRKDGGLMDDLVETAEHCSDQERVAEKAERTLVEWKQVAFMSRYLGSEFDGHVTGVMGFGIFVELERFFVEGLVHVSNLEDDHYSYDDKRHRLVGDRTGRVLRLGDRVKVRVAKADLEQRRLDFELVGGPKRASRKKKGGEKKGRKKGRKGRRSGRKGGRSGGKGGN